MKSLIILSIFILSACSSTSEITATSTDIIQLIEKVEKRFPEGVRGTFQIPIKASGSENGVIYLNSNLDYREPSNISVVLSPMVIKSLSTTYDSSPDLYFIAKTIEVTGKAERVKIYYFKNGKRTKKYYFQTHIRVNSIDKLKILR
jgi:hypothetical protein